MALRQIAAERADQDPADPWAAWDAYKLRECRVPGDDVYDWLAGDGDQAPQRSRRHYKLCKAYQNYRRTITHLLEKMKFK